MRAKIKKLLLPLTLTALLGCATIIQDPYRNLYEGYTSLGNTRICYIENIDPQDSGMQITIENGDTTVVLFNRNPKNGDNSLGDLGDSAMVRLKLLMGLYNPSVTFAHDYVITPNGEKLETRLMATYTSEQQNKLFDSQKMLKNRFTDLYQLAIREAYNSEGWKSTPKLIDPQPH